MALSTTPVPFKIAADQNLFVAFDIRTEMFVPPTGSLVDRSADGIQSVRDMKIVLPDEAVVATIAPAGPPPENTEIVNLVCGSSQGVVWNFWIDSGKKTLLWETVGADGSKNYATYPVQITDSSYVWDDHPGNPSMNWHRTIDRITGHMTLVGPSQGSNATQPFAECSKGSAPMPAPKL